MRYECCLRFVWEIAACNWNRKDTVLSTKKITTLELQDNLRHVWTGTHLYPQGFLYHSLYRYVSRDLQREGTLLAHP